MTLARWLRPDLLVHAIEEIDFDWLEGRNVRGLLLDVDNTIVPWRSREIPDEKRSWIEQAKSRFAVCLLSNTIFMDRLRHIASELGVDFVARAFCGRKPFPGGFREALRRIDIPASQAAMIGDQVFADVLGGKLVGCVTVLVDPVSPTNEFIGTRIVRCVERRLRERWWTEQEAIRE